MSSQVRLQHFAVVGLTDIEHSFGVFFNANNMSFYHRNVMLLIQCFWYVSEGGTFFLALANMRNSSFGF